MIHIDTEASAALAASDDQPAPDAGSAPPAAATRAAWRQEAWRRDGLIGQRIKARRISMGLSQQALGEILGVTFQQIQKYERGSNRCSAGRLSMVAEKLDVPVTFFFDDLDPAVRRSEIPQPDRQTLELNRNFLQLDDRLRAAVFRMVKAINATGATPPEQI